MESVLYQYHFDIVKFLPTLIPLLVGVGFLLNSIRIRSKSKQKGWEGFIQSFFKIAGFVVAPLCALLFTTMVFRTIVTHINYTNLIENNKLKIVEGYVEKFHPMPYEGHDTERFEISGVCFEYSDYDSSYGYNKSKSHGGLIKENGQHLKIKYTMDEIEGNCILYIAEINNDQN